MTEIRLVDLLRYKKKVDIEAGGKKITKWVRIIGDTDLQESYRLGRVASAKVRRDLKNPETIEYQDQMLPVEDATKEDCIAAIKVSMTRVFNAEADANVERADLPELEEFAIDPDAATLEEQEKLDAATVKVQVDYIKAKEEYVSTRVDVLDAELKSLSIKDLRKRAGEEIINTIALQTFLIEVQSEKVWRGIYSDKECKEREFNNRKEFQDLPDAIRNPLYNAYADLEINGDDIKN